MPQSRTERRAYDLIAEGFGPGANGPLVIAVDVADDPAVLAPLAAAVAADPGIAEVSPARGRRRLRASPSWSPSRRPPRSPRPPATPSTGSGPTSSRRRSTAAPPGPTSAARWRSSPTSATACRSGCHGSSPLSCCCRSLLLLVVFRSLLVPLKAAVMNLLSVGAAYGVLVMVFQWGWGADLIGLESTVPILSFIPLFMFAILFGLSMDYEVFLLSRVREEYDRTGDNDEAVARGLAGTARTITSRGPDHGRGLRRLRARRRPAGQDDGSRPGHRDRDRRDHRPAGAGAGHDDAAGQGELVAAGLARPAAAGRPRTKPAPTAPADADHRRTAVVG